MDVLLMVKAALMGVVEGLTEFLPISSTGHLILAGSLLGLTGDKVKVFEIAIQTGAILAVVIVYWHKIRATLVELPRSRQAQRFALNVVIAFVPTDHFGGNPKGGKSVHEYGIGNDARGAEVRHPGCIGGLGIKYIVHVFARKLVETLETGPDFFKK